MEQTDLSKPCCHGLILIMNEESIRNRIRILLDEIQNKTDPVMLNRCRSIFRQEVSFFHRSYMAAYLLLLAEGSDQTMEKSSELPADNVSRSGSSGGKKGFFRDKQAKKARSESLSDETRSEAPRVLSEEESVQLFVSIGRNRKVFPREILALIIARAKIGREDIGMIRVLDNYSFVQVRSDVSDTIIEALHGTAFRGRTLTVNYARSREENNTEE